MRSNDRKSLERGAFKHEHGWEPIPTLYSSAAAPTLNSLPIMRSDSTTSTRPSHLTAAEPGQVERISNEAKRNRIKDHLNERWMKQRNSRRNWDSSATEGLVEAGEEVKSVKLTEVGIETAGPRRRDGSPTVPPDPGDSKTSSIEPFRETLTIHAKQRSPISTDTDDATEAGRSIPRVSAYLQGRMRLDPGAYEGGYYRHPERHW